MLYKGADLGYYKNWFYPVLTYMYNPELLNYPNIKRKREQIFSNLNRIKTKESKINPPVFHSFQIL
jgi:hypothetical protein